VSGLEGELSVISKLAETLTRLSGHGGAPAPAVARRDPVSGLGKEAAVNIRGQMTESEVKKAAAEVESKTAVNAQKGGG
jgi:hypothetical protein